eukprot:5754301-Pleurochrysis_carterae.AAC.1
MALTICAASRAIRNDAAEFATKFKRKGARFRITSAVALRAQRRRGKHAERHGGRGATADLPGAERQP